MNSNKKHLRDTICIWVVCILSFLMAIMWFYSDKTMLDIKPEEITSIEIIEVSKERAVAFTGNPDEIKNWAEKLNKTALERQTLSFSKKGGDYRIQVYKKNGKSKTILLRSKEDVQIGYRTYKIKGKSTLYEEIQELFLP